MKASHFTEWSRRDPLIASECGEHSDDRIALALEEYAAAIEAGEPIGKESLLAKYADVADELAGCLDSLDFIRQVAPQLGDVAAESGNKAGAAIRPLATLGDFRIVREIGRGGMGVVYEAEQLSLGRRVALKVLPFAAMLGDMQLKRFHNEARAAATLDHPNIVAVHFVGVERGVHYYAMQLIEGRSLAEVIAAMKEGGRGQDAGGREHQFLPLPLGEGRGEGAPTIEHRFKHLPPPPSGSQVAAPSRDTVAAAHLSTIDELHSLLDPRSSLPEYSSREYFRAVARLGVQGAEALDHAHQNGILHRDIKPANLLLDNAGKLWVTDFGLARIEQDAGMTMTGDLIGTLRYMSPEQALAKRVVIDHRSDIYSLGVTLYELLSLQPAHAAADRQELLKQIAFEEPTRLRKLCPQLPAELETIVVKTLEKNPGERYETAARLAADLQAWLDEKPIKAQPPGVVQRAVKWSRRHRPLVASVGVSLLLVVLVSLAILAYSNVVITKERNEKAVALARESELRLKAELEQKRLRMWELMDEGRNDEAEALFNEIPRSFMPTAEQISMRSNLGIRHLVREHWREAAANWDFILQSPSVGNWNNDSIRFVIGGPIMVLAGDPAMFERFRNTAFSQLGSTTNPVVAERLCRMCLLLPADEDNLRQAQKLAEVVLAGQKDPSLIKQEISIMGEGETPEETAAYVDRYADEFKGWGGLALSMYEYRSGHYARALHWSEECLQDAQLEARVSGRSAAAEAVAAMACFQLRRDFEARTRLAQAVIINDAADLGAMARDAQSADGNALAILDGLQAYLLIREASSLINGTPSPHDLGYAAGQNVMGNLYTRGVRSALRVDYVQALQWYRKSADQGFAPAQLNLAFHYVKGWGVDKNQETARSWRQQCSTNLPGLAASAKPRRSTR